MKFHLSDEEALKQLKHTSDNIKFDDLTIEERSIHYAYIETKKEFLTLFVHGSPGSFSTFIDFFQSDSLLKKTDIVSVDRPGFGQSNFGIAETSIKRQAALIHEVAQLFPHKKKILVGHSLGGPVIARMTMDHPKSYDGLLYIAPSIDPNLEKKEWYRSIIDTQIGRLLTPIELKVSNEEILPLKDELNKMLPLWENIVIPNIIIHGTEDQFVPVENVAFLKKMLPDSLLSIKTLEGVDHFIPWSHPTVIHNAIIQLIERIQ